MTMARDTLRPPEARVGFSPKSVLLGAILGVDASGHCIAIATLCFAGGLSIGLGLASGLFMLATAIATLSLTFFSQLRVAVGIAQDTSIAILAPAVVLAGLAATTGPEAQVMTGLAVIGLSAILSGTAFWVIGRRGLGRVVRLFPYSVAAGFLASSGYLLVAAAVSMLIGGYGEIETGLPLISQAALINLVPAVALAAAMLVAMHITPSPAPILILIGLFVAGFYVALGMFDMTSSDARAMGLLPNLQGNSAMSTLDLDPSLIDWSSVLTTAPTIAAVVLINLIAVLLNISGVELALNEDVDVNRELRVSGLTNVVIGLTGGLTAFLQGGATIIAGKTKTDRYSLGIGYSVTVLAAFFFATKIVAALPVFAAAGLLIFVGASMLGDWLLAMRHRLVRADWAIVLGIVLVTAFAGILPAIAVGLTLAVFSFAVAYARLPVIRGMTDGRVRRSVVDRPAEAADFLSQEGVRIQILHLQSALFFGSVEKLKDDILGIVEKIDNVRFLILDFSEVSTIDSAACVALDKMRLAIEKQGVIAMMSNLAPDHRSVFDQWGLTVQDRTIDGIGYSVWLSLDDALEASETALIGDIDAEFVQSVADLLGKLSNSHPRVDELISRMERLSLARGDSVIREGDKAADIFILETGHLVVQLTNPEGVRMRVRSMAPGAIVGEIAHFLELPRGADVIASDDAIVYRISAETLADISQNDRDLTALLLQILARALATKVSQTNSLLTNFQSNRSLTAIKSISADTAGPSD